MEESLKKFKFKWRNFRFITPSQKHTKNNTIDITYSRIAINKNHIGI